MRIVGQLVCGPGEADRYLKETLEEFKRLCDDVIVCLCNAGEAEKKLIKSYDFRAYEDNREWGKFQPYIKTELLKKITKLGAEYILVLDADETLPTIRSKNELVQLSNGREAAQFYVTNLWNDINHYSRSLSFWNIRYYRCDPSKGQQFLKKPLHCGNAPPYFYTLSARQSYVPHILLHKGLMTRQDRLRKAHRYNTYDPNAEFKGREYYDALVSDGSGTEYNQEKVLNKIINYCQTL